MPEPKKRKNGSTSTKGKAKEVNEVPAPASQPPLDLSADIISVLSSGPVLNSRTEAVLSRLSQGGSSDLPQGNATQRENNLRVVGLVHALDIPSWVTRKRTGPVPAVQRHTVCAGTGVTTSSVEHDTP